MPPNRQPDQPDRSPVRPRVPRRSANERGRDQSPSEAQREAIGGAFDPWQRKEQHGGPLWPDQYPVQCRERHASGTVIRTSTDIAAIADLGSMAAVT